MNAIEAQDLVREYAPGRGACGVSFRVAMGECYGVLGRNGSGKSTLVQLLLGLERASSGTLAVLGTPVRRGSRRHLARCGAALERSAHWRSLSGRQNAWFAARSYGLSRAVIARRLARWLDAADLTDQADEPVATYSFGMRKKLSLVEALVPEPDLLVLDEPTAAVDAHFALCLTEEIRRRCAEGKSTFLASNDPDWLGGAATRVAFVEAGRIAAEGTVEQHLADLSSCQELRVPLAAAQAVPAPPDLPGLRSFGQQDHTVTVVGENDPALVARVIEWISSNGGRPRRIALRGPSLRDAFLARTGVVVDG